MKCVILIGILLFIPTIVKGQNSCSPKQIAGVDRPWDYKYGRDVHPIENRWYILLGNQFSVQCCGHVIGWEFQANVRAVARPIEFQIWRPGESNDFKTYRLIGRYDYWYIKGGSLTVDVILEPDQYIQVQEGDIIGWHTPIGDVIDYGRAYQTDQSSAFIMQRGVASINATQQMKIDTAQIQYGRTYGIKVLLAKVDQPSIQNLPRLLTLPCPILPQQHLMTIEALPSTKDGNLMFSVPETEPWIIVHGETGRVESKTTLHSNVTVEVPITATSTCGVTTTSMLSLRCIHVHSIPHQLTTPTSLITATMKPPTAPYHVTVLESVKKDTALYSCGVYSDNESKSTNTDGAKCTIKDTVPVSAKNAFFTAGSFLFLFGGHDLRYNQTREIEVSLLCVHSNGQATGHSITVHLLQDTPPSPVNFPALVTVPLEGTVGEAVFVAKATDRENLNVTFVMEECDCPFTMTIYGEVLITKELKSQTTGHFKLSVRLHDGFNIAGPYTVSMKLSAINRPPMLILPKEKLLVIPENTRGVEVCSLEAIDPDGGNGEGQGHGESRDDISIKWAWGQVEALQFFDFNATTLTVSVKPDAKLDFEKLRRHGGNLTTFDFLVTMSDGYMTSQTDKIVFQIVDVNEAPKFKIAHLNVSCYQGKSGTLALKDNLTDLVHDPDADDELNFDLLSEPGSEDFIIDSLNGKIKFREDYQVKTPHISDHRLLIVIVSDKEGLSDRLTVALEIKSVNRVPTLPGLPAHVTIYEQNGAINVTVFTVTVFDADGDDVTLRYHMTNETDDVMHGLISLDETAKEIRLRQFPPLSHSNVTTSVFSISAYDGRQESQSVVLNVTIVGVNDPPRFAQPVYYLALQEVKLSSAVCPPYTKTTVDLDPDDILTYEITEVSSSAEFISVDERSGCILFHEEYDVDKANSSTEIINVTVMAHDGFNLTATTTVVLHILDSNDNSPVVDSDGEVVILTKSQFRLGAKLTKLIAHDEDAGQNGKVFFSLVGSSVNDTDVYFVLAADGWLISTGRTPPRDDMYLHVAAADGGSPSNVAVATVQIVIGDDELDYEVAAEVKQTASSGDSSKERDLAFNRGSVVLILIALLVCSSAAIMVLAYQLWKARRTIHRGIRSQEQAHDEVHDYRFQWVPRQIADDDINNPEPETPSTTSFPEFHGNSLINQNFCHEPETLQRMAFTTDSRTSTERSREKTSRLLEIRIPEAGPSYLNKDEMLGHNKDTNNITDRQLPQITTESREEKSWHFVEVNESNSGESSYPNSKINYISRPMYPVKIGSSSSEKQSRSEYEDAGTQENLADEHHNSHFKTVQPCGFSADAEKIHATDSWEAHKQGRAKTTTQHFVVQNGFEDANL